MCSGFCMVFSSKAQHWPPWAKLILSFLRVSSKANHSASFEVSGPCLVLFDGVYGDCERRDRKPRGSPHFCGCPPFDLLRWDRLCRSGAAVHGFPE